MPEHEWKDIIVQMANAMIDYDWRLLDIVSNFGYSLTTVYKSITEDLQYIDDEKYIQCRHIMNRHKHERLSRGGRY